MLVLTRKPGEKIIIGDEIVLTLIAIRRDDQYGDRIRIGLDAPSHVPIRREEVADARKAGDPAPPEQEFISPEDESRSLRQKVDALESQVARHRGRTGLGREQAGELSAALATLRKRCDRLLDELNQAVANAEPSAPRETENLSENV
ncbi:MAG: carbon storage regulator [Planctomycetota bacterium]|jgi:carbon storage regulator